MLKYTRRKFIYTSSFFLLLNLIYFCTTFAQKRKSMESPDFKIDTIINDNSSVFALTLSMDEKLLAYGDLDGKVKVLKPSSKEFLYDLKAHEGWVNSISFSPDGKFLASGGSDSVVQIWDMEKGKLIKTISGFQRSVNIIYFHLDNSLIIAADKLILYDINLGKISKEFNDTSKNITALAVNSSKNIISCGTVDGRIIFLDLKTFQRQRIFSKHKQEVSSLAFSTDGKLFASGGMDSVILIWDMSKMKNIFQLKGHKEQINSLLFNPGNKYLVSGGWDRNIIFWNLKSRKAEFVINDNINVISGVLLYKNQLISSCFDKTIKFYTISPLQKENL